MDLSAQLLEWLAASHEPSIAYRVLQDLQEVPPTDPRTIGAQDEIGRTGWAAAILGLQLSGGQWSTPGSARQDLYRPKYIATNWQLIVLTELGLSSQNPGARRGCELILERYSDPADEDELGGPGSEVCFTGNAVRYLRHFGFAGDPRVRHSIEWLIDTQKPDGGWHCFPSDTGTLDGWEALAAFAEIPAEERSDRMQRAIDRGAQFYLDRGLMREGAEEYPPWRRVHYPVHYYYDYLVGLEMLTRLGHGADDRMAPALELLEERRNRDGTWNLDALHPDIPLTEPYQPRPPFFPYALEVPGAPSRWITVRALAVLHRAGRL